MAQKVQVVLADDVDGGQADETIQFALDGISYEIDLSSDHAEALRESFAEWVEHARRVAGRAKRGTATRVQSRPAVERVDLSDVRAWAREHGYEVSDRGRISQEIKDAYAAAH